MLWFWFFCVCPIDCQIQTSLTDFLVYSPREAQMTFSQGMLFGLDVHFILMSPRGSIHLASQACLPANRQLVQQHPYKAAVCGQDSRMDSITWESRLLPPASFVQFITITPHFNSIFTRKASYCTTLNKFWLLIHYPYHLLAETLDSFLPTSVVSNINKNIGSF